MSEVRCCACGETFPSRHAAGQHLISNPPSHFFEEVADAAVDDAGWSPEDGAGYIPKNERPQTRADDAEHTTEKR